MKLGADVRKPLDLAARFWSLACAGGNAALVDPRASYSARDDADVLVLQAGPNPSVDYYLRPRLDVDNGRRWQVRDLGEAPDEVLASFGDRPVFVVICRLFDARWTAALKAAAPRIGGCAYFVDDDLPAMLADRSLPATLRGRIARDYARHARALGGVCDRVWVSTQGLAERYRTATPAVIAPVIDLPPAPPRPSPPALVVYHATASHGAERTFVLEIARRMARQRPDISFELVGDKALARACADIANVSVIPQEAWPSYARRQEGRAAAVLLAPLFPTPVNTARAPVKIFDAVRLGAAGIYADATPYNGYVRPGIDGYLAAMEVQPWVEAIVSAIDDEDRRYGVAAAAFERVETERATVSPLPLRLSL